MATNAPAQQPQRQVAARGDRFYFRFSVFILAVGVLGFAPTYWLQLPAGTVDVPAIIHLHGIVFTAWLVLLVVQSWLASQGRLRNHRAWGLSGISLATLVFALGVVGAVAALKLHLDRGEGDAARAFFIIPFTSVSGFALFFAAAIANVRRPDWHKRFMIVATLSLVAAAVGRFFFFSNNGMQPGVSPISMPYGPVINNLRVALVTDGVILFAMIRDWRVEGRVHPAWMWGFGGLLAIGLLRIPFSGTSAWFAFADWMARF